MPNEDIDVSNLEQLEKYRSFDRYRRRAEQEARNPHWWRTYREHFGEESGAGRPASRLGGGGAAGVLPEHWRRGPASAHVRTVGHLVPPGFFTPFGSFIWKIPFSRC